MTTPTATKRQVEYLPLGSLKPDPRNPKAHNVDTIDASIGRFGYVESIVLDARTGFIVSGHGRTKALQVMQERGDTPPDGVTVNAKGQWLVPVVTGWASRSDAEAAAALVALNRTTELGGWVDEALLSVLDDLSQMDDGLVGVGYTDEDRETLRRFIEASTLFDGEEGEVYGGDDAAVNIGEHEVVSVVVEKGHRQDVYAMLQDVDWVVDVRNGGK